MNRKPIYTSFGIVIHGRGIGKLVGTPTANLKVENEKQLPENGVYITRIFLDNQIYYGITHIGTRPTVDNDTDISVETHILNFSRDLYGSKIEIQLFEKLRNPMKFDNLSLLLEQIRLDCLSVQEFWGIDYSASRLTIDIKKHLVKVDGKEVFLSTKEFDVLYMLYSNPEVTFTKEEIYQVVWHEPSNGYCHAVENTVFQIRKKTATIVKGLTFIKTVAGYGYKYNPAGTK